MENNFAMQQADFLDQWREKIFLGQEFLTWLWIITEINGHSMTLDNFSVDLWFENKIQLESGQGDYKRVVTCQTPDDEWAEAYTAIKENKKICKGRLRVKTEDNDWSFSLSADTLIPQGVKLINITPEKDENLAGMLLDRVALIEELFVIIDQLFKKFLEIRLTDQWDALELPKMQKWLTEKK